MQITPIGGEPVETFGREEQEGGKEKLAMLLFKASMGPVHKELEQSPLIKKIMEALISEDEYSRYLVALHGIYTSLEAGLEKNNRNPCIKPLCIPELYRSEPLKSDLSCFKVHFRYPGKVLQNYQRYIQEIAFKEPIKLISHAYTRYMGDLYGGQKMKKKIEELWDKAVAFYDFGKLVEVYQLKQPTMFVRQYTNIINQLPVEEENYLTLISEIDAAFLWHKRIFEELSSESLDD